MVTVLCQNPTSHSNWSSSKAGSNRNWAARLFERIDFLIKEVRNTREDERLRKRGIALEESLKAHKAEISKLPELLRGKEDRAVSRTISRPPTPPKPVSKGGGERGEEGEEKLSDKPRKMIS